MSEEESKLFNQLPEPHLQGHQQKREKTEFEDQAKKDQWDIGRLIEKARVQSLGQGIAINPLDLLKREDDDPERLRKAFAMCVSNETTKFADLVREYPGLQRYRSDYDKWRSGMKSRCSWHTVQDRLLANDARYLKLAENLDQKGILFGVDIEGNPLIADKSQMPSMSEENYPNARKKVMLEKSGVATGYELFPYKPEKEKSIEIEMFESFTGKPFIQPLDERFEAKCWLEDGEFDSTRDNGNTIMAKYDHRKKEATIIKPVSEQGINNVATSRRLLRLKAA